MLGVVVSFDERMSEYWTAWRMEASDTPCLRASLWTSIAIIVTRNRSVVTGEATLPVGMFDEESGGLVGFDAHRPDEEILVSRRSSRFQPDLVLNDLRSLPLRLTPSYSPKTSSTRDSLSCHRLELLSWQPTASWSISPA